MKALICFSLIINFVIVNVNSFDWDEITALDEYVHSNDGAFQWTEVVRYSFPETGATVYVVNMTSQYYQDASFSSQPVWWHIMTIAIPDVILYPDAALMLIDGGTNRPGNPPPDRNHSSVVGMAAIANQTFQVAACISQIPNQPIVFTNDPTQKSRSEDSIIAWTWRTYLDQPASAKDPTVILRMPMTKAAKRGLDTVFEFSKLQRPETNITRFLIYGASKRGWTTWSLAATDRRVIAMAPMVFSLLNINTTMLWHFQNMNGAYSFALEPYYNENLTREYFNPDTVAVFEVEDMYYYKDRFTLPILEIVSSGDEFFLCDENWYWWDGIPSTSKYLMMLPNAEHSMSPHYISIVEAVGSFWLNILDNVPLPAVSWDMNPTATGGSILFHTNPPPRELPKAYYAVTLSNDTRRDYRLAALDETGEIVAHPVVWTNNLEVIDLGNGEYYVQADEVPGEWVGLFVEATWDSGQSGFKDYRFIATSQVSIIPDTRPRGPCDDPDECQGYLV